jgi:succinate dehydrogenase hydrophobic anchor subunit
MVVEEAKTLTTAFLSVVVTAVILIVLGIVFFAVSLFIINMAAYIVFGPEQTLSPSMVVLSAALITAASLVGSKSR